MTTTIATETALLNLAETIAATRANNGHPASLAVVESTLRRGQMPPLHSHDDDEVIYVLEGTMTVHTGDRSVRLEQGEAVVALRRLPHTQCAESEGVRYLSMTFVPSVGRYEDFLRAVAVPRTESPDWSDEEAAVLGIAHGAGVSVLGPPGELPTVA